MNEQPISKQDKYECARRELALRKAVYQTLILRRKMSKEKAEREIAIMQAIVNDYKPEEGS